MQHGGLPGFVPRVRTVAVGLLPFLWLGCDDGQSLEATIDAKPGIEQVGSADGPLLDEDAACMQLYQALLGAKDSNGCDEVAVAECPELIRPGGSLACVRYSQDSVDQCVAAIGDYSSCKDFVRDACVVVAVVGETSAGCVPPGPQQDAGSFDAGAGDDDSGDDDLGSDDDVASQDAGADDDTTSDDDVGDDDAMGPADAGSDVMADASAPQVDSGVASAPDAGGGAPDAAVADSGAGGPDAGDAAP